MNDGADSWMNDLNSVLVNIQTSGWARGPLCIDDGESTQGHTIRKLILENTFMNILDLAGDGGQVQEEVPEAWIVFVSIIDKIH